MVTMTPAGPQDPPRNPPIVDPPEAPTINPPGPPIIEPPRGPEINPPRPPEITPPAPPTIDPPMPPTIITSDLEDEPLTETPDEDAPDGLPIPHDPIHPEIPPMPVNLT